MNKVSGCFILRYLCRRYKRKSDKVEVSVQIAYSGCIQKLRTVYDMEEARAMTDRLFDHIFHLSPTQRVLSAESIAGSNEIKQLAEAVHKLINNEPLQYVLGTAYFMNLIFDVNPSVLIPRHETEELVQHIINSVNEEKAGKEIKILDIGTGSGCIAIALKHLLPEARVTAIDVSQDALIMAETNARKNDAEIEFIHSDIMDSTQWNLFPPFDIIVSNPPYVTVKEKSLMHSNVIDYEPHLALFVPNEDPLRFYKAITRFSVIKLKHKGQLWFEINEAFGKDVLTLFEDEIFHEKELLRDINGRDRITFAIKK